jgi:hypothetical protein
MKETGHTHAILNEEDEVKAIKPRGKSPKPNTKHINLPPWHKLHAEAIDNTDPALYPKLWEQKGMKGKISLTPFEALISDAHQIFDCNRDIFKNISQVYNLAFYRGMMDLQYQYVVRRGISISIMSKLLKDEEKQIDEENEVGRAIEYIKDCVDRLQKGWITEEEYLKKESNLISIFQPQRLADKVRGAINNLFENGEEGKSIRRLDMRKRREEAKRKNITVI